MKAMKTAAAKENPKPIMGIIAKNNMVLAGEAEPEEWFHAPSRSSCGGSPSDET
jgi:hypothetical protein